MIATVRLWTSPDFNSTTHSQPLVFFKQLGSLHSFIFLSKALECEPLNIPKYRAENRLRIQKKIKKKLQEIIAHTIEDDDNKNEVDKFINNKNK